jgi:hypothetical protein
MMLVVVSHPSDKDLSPVAPALADAQHMLVTLGIHAHRADHHVFAEDQATNVYDEQFQLVEAPRELRFQLRLRGLNRSTTYNRLTNSDGFGHPRNYVLVVARGDAAPQCVQYARAQRRLILHGGVGGNLDFLATSTLAAQTRPLNFQLAIAEQHLTRLPAIEDHSG